MCSNFTCVLLRTAGLLTSGIVPAMRHCLQSILTDDAIIIPASATVYVQVLIPPAPLPSDSQYPVSSCGCYLMQP